MCGIICEIFYNESRLSHDKSILSRIKNRGPDSCLCLEKNVEDGLTICFNGAVLWMQGPQAVKQPVENNTGILLYNGDIFDETLNPNISDTQVIMDKLTESNNEQMLLQTIKSLKGPFSIIYYDKKNKNLYFSRDRIGRSSLLFTKNENSIIISSVLSRNFDCVEIPATHINRLNLKSKRIFCHSWTDSAIEEHTVENWLEFLQQLQSKPDNDFTFNFDDKKMLSDHTGVVEHIQYIAGNFKCNTNIMEKILEHNVINNTVKLTYDLLEKSVKIRLAKQPHRCKECLFNNSVCEHSTVGILFSGGLDCTILALLADKYIPINQSIDLINVAFKKHNSLSYDVPDRLTGRQSLEELKHLNPHRKWVFRDVNVSKEELQEYQISTIADLVYPRQTILDESLGSALWFAARSKDDKSISPSRVLLLGSGADELFGGYIRHRNAYRRGGWTLLQRELELDWNRISLRNLARDNRVICDHGRQPRMPYLDDDFTSYVLSLDPWLKCFPSNELGPGIGDKLLLRLIAFKLGLSQVAHYPKRALQFGSRIANKKEKGSDISKTFDLRHN